MDDAWHEHLLRHFFLSYLIVIGCVLLLAVKLEKGGLLFLLLPLVLGPLWTWFLARKHNFSLGSYAHRLVPFSFHGHLATTPHALRGKCRTPPPDRRISLAVGHRQKHVLLVEQFDPPWSCRFRPHPPKCRAGVDHRRGPVQSARYRL